MKIAFCVPDMVIGGVEAVLTRTLDSLYKTVKSVPEYEDTELFVITHAKITEPLYKLWFKEHPEINLYTYYPLQNFFEGLKPYTSFFLARQLRKVIFSLYKKFKRIVLRGKFSDIDVFVDYKNCSFFKELANYDKRKITWIHGSVDYLLENNMVNRLPLYDTIVGLTDDFVNDVKKAFPTLSDRVIRIYNPIDAHKIASMAKEGEPYVGKYFCHVSRLENTQKDIKTLLYAFDDFYKSNGAPDVKLVIVGDGPCAGELKNLSASLQSANNVVFTGVQRNPFGYMAGAMANILSSRCEGLPTVLIESMVLNRLCVSSDCKNGPREILLDGQAGILFDTGNVTQLSNILTEVYKGKIDYIPMVKKATQSLQRFSPDAINSQIMDLLWK